MRLHLGPCFHRAIAFEIFPSRRSESSFALNGHSPRTPFATLCDASTCGFIFNAAGTRPGGRVTFLLHDKKVTKESCPTSSARLRRAALLLALPCGQRCKLAFGSNSIAGLPRPPRPSLGDSEGEVGAARWLNSGCSVGANHYSLRILFTRCYDMRPFLQPCRDSPRRVHWTIWEGAIHHRKSNAITLPFSDTNGISP